MSSAAKHHFSGQVAGTVTDIEPRSTVQATIRALVMINTLAAVSYLQIFNKPAASVTLGTTAPTLSIGLPISAAMVYPVPEWGLMMGGGGLSVAGTTTRTGLTGAAIDINLSYE